MEKRIITKINPKPPIVINILAGENDFISIKYFPFTQQKSLRICNTSFANINKNIA